MRSCECTYICLGKRNIWCWDDLFWNHQIELCQEEYLCPDIRCSGTWTDKRNILEKVRENVLNITRNKRLLLHGGNDLTDLGISSEDVEKNTEIIDTATLFIDWESHSIGLETHDKFWYNHRKLQRDNWVHWINGHSPERDSQLTLLIHRNYVKSQYMGRRPTGSDIRRAKNNRYIIEQGKNELT